MGSYRTISVLSVPLKVKPQGLQRKPRRSLCQSGDSPVIKLRSDSEKRQSVNFGRGDARQHLGVGGETTTPPVGVIQFINKTKPDVDKEWGAIRRALLADEGELVVVRHDNEPLKQVVVIPFTEDDVDIAKDFSDAVSGLLTCQKDLESKTSSKDKKAAADGSSGSDDEGDTEEER